MRQDIDRRIGEKLDVVAAMGQGSLDIAGGEHLEKSQHALPMKIPVHLSLRRSCTRFALSTADHSGPNCAAINRQKVPPAAQL
jgi:hypothetical protein